MPFDVVVLKDNLELSTTPHGESLAGATAHAISRFAIHRSRHGATEVQVRNERGDILFRRSGREKLP